MKLVIREILLLKVIIDIKIEALLVSESPRYTKLVL